MHCFTIVVIVCRVSLLQRSCALSGGGWTDTAKKAATGLALSQREKLRELGLLDVKRPVTIKAQRLSNAPEDWLRNDHSKIVHFQRHGQGYHNLVGDVYRELGQTIDFDSFDPLKNPFVRPEMMDAPLTETGRQQCLGAKPQADLLNPQVLIVSPLVRAMQTADISFGSHRDTIPWIAHEGCREELGHHNCNKRRTVTQHEADFGHIDFTGLTSDEDKLWKHDERESPQSKSERVYNFLVDFVRNCPEQEIAVIGHSAWLFNMCNAVMDCGDDEELTSWFLTSEIRSMRLLFSENDDAR